MGAALPPRPDQILRLYLARPHLPVLRTFLNVLYQLLLLVLQLDPLPVELPLSLLKSALVFPETFLRGHALAKSPFYNLLGL